MLTSRPVIVVSTAWTSREARTHGIAADNVLRAVCNVLRPVERDNDGETRLFVIGADRGGGLLEIVAVSATDPQRVIHADVLRPKFYDYL